MEWCLCPRCNHKLFKYDKNGKLALVIKCSSCKTIVNILLTKDEVAYGESET